MCCFRKLLEQIKNVKAITDLSHKFYSEVENIERDELHRLCKLQDKKNGKGKKKRNKR